jgi:1-phosphatidylinositol-3-phosphate 5-kinase
MVRVCNLCLDKLAKVDSDDEDDHRSVVSISSPFPAHQFGSDPFSSMNLNLNLANLGNQSQSPFAASQLFGKTDEPFNLYSIAETKRPISRSENSSMWGSSRPITPTGRGRTGANGQMVEDHAWEPIRENPAPFRRGLTDEEKDLSNLPNPFSNSASNDDSPLAPGSKIPIEFPITVPVSVDGSGATIATSSIQFPGSSPEHGGLDSPRPGSVTMRSRFDSYGGDFEVPTPFIRSRVQSRLDSLPSGEPGWRTRRESTA